jgi:hypothetical protein
MVLLYTAVLFSIFPFLALFETSRYRRRSNWAHIFLLYCYCGTLPVYSFIVNTSALSAAIVWVVGPWTAFALLGELIYRSRARREVTEPFFVRAGSKNSLRS